MPEQLESPFTRRTEARADETVSYLEPRPTNWLEVIAAVAICQGAGLIGVLTSRDQGRSPWYRKLEKPEFMPPRQAYGPVWSLLYTLMGLALHQLWRQRHTTSGKSALKWFAVQLGLNAAWTPAFFGARSITGGLGVIGALAAALPVTVAKAGKVSRPAGLLLLPYLAWVGFATVLNGAIAALNPRQVRKELNNWR